jgi:hypothetical protein
VIPWILLGLIGLPPANGVDHDALARAIDARIAERLNVESVEPAPPADDAEFLRRTSLDLIGCIPMAEEVRAYLADTDVDKRPKLVDRLIADARHARHFARTWRALLLPEIETEPQLRYLQPGFEKFLEQRRLENAGFDVIVRDLLTVPIASPDQTPEFVLRDLNQPNPIAFFAAKDAEPEKIASSSIRTFLGLRLECAECHNHPFDPWTREQFWSQAAFFAGIERRGKGPFAPLVEVADRIEISLMNTERMVPVQFLDEAEPLPAGTQSPRVEFAAWMTSPSNPYFAKAIVNRVWSQLLGTGLSEPVDDFSAANPPSHPELLDELASAFRESGYDLSLLLRAICRSEAYQRTSRLTEDNQSPPGFFARMAIRPMSPDQFADCILVAIQAQPADDRVAGDDVEELDRRRILDLLQADGSATDPATSVTQALAFMNGRIVDRATRLATNTRLQQILDEFPDSSDRQIEALFLVTLSRLPTDAERETISATLKSGQSNQERGDQLGNLLWALLNSPEFRWNH